MLGEIPKPAAAILKFSFDWVAWLGTDTLASATWTLPAGLTKVSETNTSTVATVKISGGTAGTSYTCICTITTTTTGETMPETFSLRVE